jgi:DNA polymerase
LANERLLLNIFEEGKDPYKEMAGYIYHKYPSEIVKATEEYQLGKNTVLGCGFGMGKEKFASTTGATLEDATVAVNAYRNTFAAVPIYWQRVNDAAIQAVEGYDRATNTGPVVRVGHCRFTRRSGYLWITLPAGRSLAYAAPKVVQRPMPWDRTDLRPSVEFSGINSYTRQWTRQHLYGGSITENIVQAVARDLMADAMLRVDGAGLPVILSVHDEVVTESPEAEGTYEKVLALMKVVPAWARGCPVDAEGWAGHRYRK